MTTTPDPAQRNLSADAEPDVSQDVPSEPTALTHAEEANGFDSDPSGLSVSSPHSLPTPSTQTGGAIAPNSRPIASLPPPSTNLILLLAIAFMVGGWVFSSFWLSLAGATVALALAARVVWSPIRRLLLELMSPEQRMLTLALIAAAIAISTLLQLSGLSFRLQVWLRQVNWDAVGAGGEVVGAVGQILIAVLAVYVAWRQYIISKDLTIQQNLITQQQTIDSYFQGISDLVLDAEGLLEDWPQERAIAEGRTAAILSSVDAGGKAKVIRFLSRSRLLSPLKRDRHLGRAILDGMGGYQEDRDFGIRVIDLGVMLAAANLSETDLRWTDLSDANLIRANLHNCDLVKANLARTVLVDADLSGSDLMGARLFYGTVQTATPRSRTHIPNYTTGAYTGAVIENVDLSGVKRLSKDQHWYCCAWGGEKTRSTIPGGCEGIPNLLGK